jgi:hypothetical protein
MAGVRASYKGKGLDVGFDYKLSDVTKMVGGVSAIGLGILAAFTDGPLPFADIFLSTPLIVGGFEVLGVHVVPDRFSPTKLIGLSNPRKVMTDEQKALLGVGAAGLLYYWWSQREEEPEVMVLETSPLPDGFVKPEFNMPMSTKSSGLSASAEAPPAADLAPGGAHGAGGSMLPEPTSATDPFYVPTPPGGRIPAGDTNLWWFPMEDAKHLGEPDLGEGLIAWATGAKPGEGYIPDSWSVIGSKKKAGEAASSAMTTTAKAVGAGAAEAAGITEDKPLIPRWLIPTMGIGALGLGFYYVSQKA